MAERSVSLSLPALEAPVVVRVLIEGPPTVGASMLFSCHPSSPSYRQGTSWASLPSCSPTRDRTSGTCGWPCISSQSWGISSFFKHPSSAIHSRLRLCLTPDSTLRACGPKPQGMKWTTSLVAFFLIIIPCSLIVVILGIFYHIDLSSLPLLELFLSVLLEDMLLIEYLFCGESVAIV